MHPLIPLAAAAIILLLKKDGNSSLITQECHTSDAPQEERNAYIKNDLEQEQENSVTEDTEQSVERKEVSNSLPTAVTGAQQTSEAMWAIKTWKRLGYKSIHGHGNILEDMIKSKYPIGPGEEIILSPKKNDPVADIIIKRGNEVKELLQIKNEISNKCRKTVRQVMAGQYRDAKLIGSTETAKLYNAKAERLRQHGTEIQPMYDSGISTYDPRRINNKLNFRFSKGKELWCTIRGAASVGFVISAITGAVCRLGPLLRGEITLSQYCAKSIRDGAGGGLAAATGAVAATVVTAVTGQAVGGLVIPLMVGVGAAMIAANYVNGFFNMLFGWI